MLTMQGRHSVVYITKNTANEPKYIIMNKKASFWSLLF